MSNRINTNQASANSNPNPVVPAFDFNKLPRDEDFGLILPIGDDRLDLTIAEYNKQLLNHRLGLAVPEKFAGQDLEGWEDFFGIIRSMYISYNIRDYGVAEYIEWYGELGDSQIQDLERTKLMNRVKAKRDEMAMIKTVIQDSLNTNSTKEILDTETEANIERLFKAIPEEFAEEFFKKLFVGEVPQDLMDEIDRKYGGFENLTEEEVEMMAMNAANKYKNQAGLNLSDESQKTSFSISQTPLSTKALQELVNTTNVIKQEVGKIPENGFNPLLDTAENNQTLKENPGLAKFKPNFDTKGSGRIDRKGLLNNLREQKTAVVSNQQEQQFDSDIQQQNSQPINSSPSPLANNSQPQQSPNPNLIPRSNIADLISNSRKNGNGLTNPNQPINSNRNNFNSQTVAPRPNFVNQNPQQNPSLRIPNSRPSAPQPMRPRVIPTQPIQNPNPQTAQPQNIQQPRPVIQPPQANPALNLKDLKNKRP